MTPLDQVFYPVFGAGCLVGAIASALAARRPGGPRAWGLLLLGTLVVWGTLWLGLELGYRAWQAMPEPPEEAYADPEPAGALFLGWIPAGLSCLALYRFFRWRRPRRAAGPPPLPPR